MAATMMAPSMPARARPGRVGAARPDEPRLSGPVVARSEAGSRLAMSRAKCNPNATIALGNLCTPGRDCALRAGKLPAFLIAHLPVPPSAHPRGLVLGPACRPLCPLELLAKTAGTSPARRGRP